MNVDLPDGPADLTARWLTGALQAAGYTDPAVADVGVTEIGTGQTGASYRLTVSFGRTTDLPPTFVVKLPAEDPEVRQRVALGYRAEVAFYDSVATTVGVPLPRCFASVISEDAQQFALLLEDLAPAEQGDQIAGCSAEAAKAGVVALAGLHGPRWCDPAWHDFTATSMPMADASMAKGLGDVARFATDQFLERYGDRLSPDDRATLDATPAHIAPWLLAVPDRFNLLHGDYRLDNLMFAPDRESVTVVDWQTLAIGLPARDLAYFIATSLAPEVRADHERALVAEYHDALSGWGVRDYSLDRCFDDYRLGLLQAPLITTLGAAFSTASERGEAMYLVMLERSLAAIRQLDTLGLVDREAA
jgi:hypothetical protein